ncbi:MAG: hypothetical protein ACFB51_03835 [Anaerolineae bacterium]
MMPPTPIAERLHRQTNGPDIRLVLTAALLLGLLLGMAQASLPASTAQGIGTALLVAMAAYPLLLVILVALIAVALVRRDHSAGTFMLLRLTNDLDPQVLFDAYARAALLRSRMAGAVLMGLGIAWAVGVLGSGAQPFLGPALVLALWWGFVAANGWVGLAAALVAAFRSPGEAQLVLRLVGGGFALLLANFIALGVMSALVLLPLPFWLWLLVQAGRYIRLSATIEAV